jgi:hypothetical protein
MSWTRDDLTAIETAIASGMLSVTIAGRTVTYRSMADLRIARDLIRQSLGDTVDRDRRYFEHSKGLDSC